MKLLHITAGHQKKVSKETQAVLKSQIMAMEVTSNEQYVKLMPQLTCAAP